MTEKIKPKLKLSEANYYSLTNKYVTNSKINDFTKDRRFFYEKHVLGTIHKDTTEAMLIGKAVDCYLTESKELFLKSYIPVERRNIKNPPAGYTEMTQKQYAEALRLAEKVESQTAFNELKGYKAQVILQYDMPLGLFYGIAGKPDWMKIKEKHGSFRDLKTTSTIDPRRYHFHCLDYNYYRQAAMYIKLAQLIYGIETYDFGHLAVEKDGDDINNCQTFILDNSMIEKEMKEIDFWLSEIAGETKFLPNDTSFKSAVTIGAPEVQTIWVDSEKEVEKDVTPTI